MKRQIKNIVVLLSFILFTLPVRAAEDTITLTSLTSLTSLTAEDNKVEAVLIQGTGEAGAEEIISLQLSFQIDSANNKLKQNEVSFEFGSSVVSAVKEYRYQPETGILNIYISGNEHITGKENISGEIPLGKVVISSKADAGIYTVKVKDNSLRTVNGAFYMDVPDIYAQTEEKVQIGSTEEGKEDTDEKDDDWSSDSDTDSDDNGNDWIFDEEEKRIPINSGHPSTGIFTTNQNPGIINSNIPELQSPTDEGLSESKVPSMESTTSDTSDASEISEGNKGSGGSSENHSGSSEETEENRNDIITVQEKPDMPDETEDITETQVQDKEEGVQKEETVTAERKKNAIIWIVAVVAAVIVAAVVAIAVVASNRQKPSRRRDVK